MEGNDIKIWFRTFVLRFYAKGRNEAMIIDQRSGDRDE